jgi:hypothetical protein
VHYRDPESATPRSREIDVVASEPPVDNGGAFVELIVEAKHSHEPWLILTAEIQSDRPVLQPTWLLATRVAQPLVTGILSGESVPRLLQLEATHGFDAVQTSDSRDPDRPNPAYVAMQAATKAAYARLKTWGPKTPVIVFPVIVVGGALVQLSYDNEGERQLQSVPWQRIRWQGSTVVDHAVVVDVVQRDHFDDWLVGARSSTESMIQLLTAWVTPGTLSSAR